MARVNVDMGGVPSKMRRLKSNREFGIYAATEAKRLMEKYVPYRSGDLNISAKAEPFKVSYVMPYAQYVYNGRGMKFLKQTHPDARSHWNEPLSNDPSELAKLLTAKARVI